MSRSGFFCVLLKGAGHGGEDFARVIAGHQVAAGAKVRLAVRNAGRQLAGDGDRDLRILLAVPQVHCRGHLIEAETPRPGVFEQIGCHDGGALPVAFPQVLNEG